jgi:hypothetical protein
MLTCACFGKNELKTFVFFQMLAAEQDKPDEPEEKADGEGIVRSGSSELYFRCIV